MSDSESNRREFLTGKSAFDSFQKRLDEQLSSFAEDPNRRRSGGYLEQYAKNAMACEFELSFNLHQYPQAAAAVMKAFQLIDDLEDQLTVYRDHSEVSRLNRSAFQTPFHVSSNLFELLQLAISIFRQTEGAFDITSTPLTNLWGFNRRSGAVPRKSDIEKTLEQVGSDLIEFESSNQTISFSAEGLSINLGGIGKGYALDEVSKLIRSNGVNDFLIHGGQSSVVAIGSSDPMLHDEVPPAETVNGIESESVADDQTQANQSTGWRIGVTHPTLPGQRLGEVDLVNEALGTSGTARQGFYHQGKRFGHIIDPRTGWPTDHFLSTTVIAETAAEADALATAFYVMQPKQVEEFCDRRPEIRAILIAPDAAAKGKIDVQTINLNGRWFPA